MKKTFSLTAPNKKPERQVDWVKHEIKKYLGRERRKSLPEGADFWDFDCKFGFTEDEAKVIQVFEIKAMVDKAVAEKQTSFYLEILAKPGKKPKKTETTSGRS